MNRVKAWIRNFFAFSRRETNAFLILLPLLFIIIFSEPIYRYWFVRQPKNYSKESKQLDSLITSFHWEKDTVQNEEKTKQFTLFSFDPNKSTGEELRSLGFNKSLANRILKYRLKGGKFGVKEDLLKIYGMDSVLFQNLYSYINLPEKKFSSKSAA
ncbi:MAG TPA: hypothetical protein DGG95_10085, partial [Cytophagales bacterium]|nr:hypothetical protein [Cytophagales bacterium]